MTAEGDDAAYEQSSEAIGLEIITSTVDDLAERFEVALDRAPAGADLTLETFRDLLAARLRMIIDQRFSGLAPLLYRIDVDEEKVDAIIRNAPFSEVPARLADLIIERRLQAMRTREIYRQTKN